MIEEFKKKYINLASARLGAQATYATDDFFAAKERMLHDTPPVFIDDKFDDHGKWMDGWETARRRGPGHDWVIIALGHAGMLKKITVDTAFFKGNYPDCCTIQAANLTDLPEDIVA